MTTRDIDSVAAEWDAWQEDRGDIHAIADELFDAADAKIAGERSPYEIIAAVFLADTMMNASMLSMPSASLPVPPKLTVCTTTPGVSDSAITNAVMKVTEPITSRSVLTTHHVARVHVNQNTVFVAASSSDKIKMASTLDEPSMTGKIDQSSLKFLRPASNAGTRKHAMERLVKDAKNSKSKNTITQNYSSRKQEILDVLNTGTKGSYAARRNKIEELPNDVYYVVDSSGKIIGLFKNKPPAKLSQITDLPLKPRNARVVGTTKAADVSSEVKHLSESEVRSEVASIIKSQIDDETTSIGRTLTTFQKDNVNVLSILVPSQGVIFKGAGKVKKGPTDERLRKGMRGGQ